MSQRNVISLILALLLCLPTVSVAGQKGKLAGFLADYEDLKSRTANLTQEVREARKAGYSSDLHPMLDLMKELSQLTTEIRKYMNEQDEAVRLKQLDSVKKGGLTPQAPWPDRSMLMAVRYSCDGMVRMLATEVDYQMSPSPKPDTLLKISAKYEEAWKLADASITETKSP